MNQIVIVKCLRCGNKWVPRFNRLPRCCARCKRYDWNDRTVRSNTKLRKKSPWWKK